jgi:hypothetical protein
MATAVVHNPEHPLGGGVRLRRHDLLDQAAKRRGPAGGFAAAEELGAVNVPGGQVGQRPAAFVLVLDAHPSGGSRGDGGVGAEACLDGGLLVGADDEVAPTKRFEGEAPLVEVEPPPGFGREVGIAGEDPAAVPPGADGIGREPPPNGGVRDRGDDALLDRGPGEIRGVPARQRCAAGHGQLARQRFDRHGHLRGGNPEAARFAVAREDRPSLARRIVCAIWRRSDGGCPEPGGDFVVGQPLGG